jgi:hypothetical protein
MRTFTTPPALRSRGTRSRIPQAEQIWETLKVLPVWATRSGRPLSMQRANLSRCLNGSPNAQGGSKAISDPRLGVPAVIGRKKRSRPLNQSRISRYTQLMTCRTALSALSLLLTFVTLEGQVVMTGRWDRVDALSPGTQIAITLKSGERLQGAFRDSNLQVLALTTLDGIERTIAKAEAQEVVQEKKKGVVNGILLGAAVGAAGGAAFGYGRRTFECRGGCSASIGAVLFTPVGALVGWLTARKQTQFEVLYRSAGP